MPGCLTIPCLLLAPDQHRSASGLRSQTIIDPKPDRQGCDVLITTMDRCTLCIRSVSVITVPHTKILSVAFLSIILIIDTRLVSCYKDIHQSVLHAVTLSCYPRLSATAKPGGVSSTPVFPTSRLSVSQHQPCKHDSIFLAETRSKTGVDINRKKN